MIWRRPPLPKKGNLMSEEILEEEVYRNALALLSNDATGELAGVFERIIDWERKNPPRSPHDGFEWHEVFTDVRILNRLVAKRILKVTLKTNRSTNFRVINVDAMEKALMDYRSMATPEVEEQPRIPPDLFEIVIGHEEKKEIIRRSLEAQQPVHVLLHGSIASAKTLMLEELSRLPNSKFILGSRLSSAGLYDVLFDERPRYLIMDELDKVDSQENLGCLLSLMERGLIIETKHGKQRSLKLKTWVFASANRLDKIPPELMSRFVPMRFRDYSDDEFLEVATKVLTIREGIPMGLAVYMADKIMKEFKSRDVRDACKVARLLKEHSKEEADKVIAILVGQK